MQSSPNISTLAIRHCWLSADLTKMMMMMMMMTNQKHLAGSKHNLSSSLTAEWFNAKNSVLYAAWQPV